MVSPEDICFRLRGVPRDWKREMVQRLMDNKFPDSEATIKTLVPDPTTNRLYKKRSTATLSFEIVPEELKDREESFPIYHDELELELDKDFEGFTPLYSSPDASSAIDIIAISGWNGHAFGSFRSKISGKMWLRDYLSQDFEDSRIFLYGYDTKKQSVQSIRDIAITFTENLRALREDSPSRPWIIIAHSLGGLVAKTAIDHMTHDPQDAPISESLRAVLFFGVPSEGMKTASFRAMMSEEGNKNLLDNLQEPTPPFLDQVNEGFSRAIRNLPGFTAFNFYETRPSPTAVQVQGVLQGAILKVTKNFWKMEGEPELLVSKFSATQGKPRNELPQHRIIPINRTHSELVKFSGQNDDTYRIVVKYLQEIKEGLWSSDTNAREAKTSGRILTRAEREYLQAIAAQGMFIPGPDAVAMPHENTCHWLFTNPLFDDWLYDSVNLLWILGSPGSGKSTLMRFASTHLTAQLGTRAVVLEFFMDHADPAVSERTPLGLYRSLLHQLLPYCPDYLAHLTSVAQGSKNRSGQYLSWSEKMLQETLLLAIEAVSKKRDIIIFVDGLETLGYESAFEVIAALKRLLEDNSYEAVPDIRLCISSRDYPSLHDGGATIFMETNNATDIETVVRANPALKGLPTRYRTPISNWILQQANGMFAWVAMTLQKIANLASQKTSPGVIMEHIKAVPVDLESLYHSSLLGGTEKDRIDSLKLFQWLVFAERPLSLAEMREALAVDAQMQQVSTRGLIFEDISEMGAAINRISRGLARVETHCADDEEFESYEESDSDFESESEDYDLNAGSNLSDSFLGLTLNDQVVRRSTASSLIPRDHPANDRTRRTIEFIHPSVKEFLKTKGLLLLQQTVNVTASSYAHYQISRSCIRYLLLSESRQWLRDVQNPISIRSQEGYREYLEALQYKRPLIGYALQFWAFHVAACHKHGLILPDLSSYAKLLLELLYIPVSPLGDAISIALNGDVVQRETQETLQIFKCLISNSQASSPATLALPQPRSRYGQPSNVVADTFGLQPSEFPSWSSHHRQNGLGSEW